MNSKENSTGTTGDASNPTGVLFGVSVSALDAYQLWSLMDAVCTLRQVAGGLVSQPRFSDDHEPTAGCAVLDGMLEQMARMMTDIDSAARSRPIADVHDARWLGWCRLRYEVEMTDQFWQVALEATTAARNEAMTVNKRVTL